MKRLLQLIVAVFSIFLIVGCSSASTTKKIENESLKDGEVIFYIMRHGKTMLNTTVRVQGWSDAVPTPEGEKTVGYAAKGLQDFWYRGPYEKSRKH